MIIFAVFAVIHAVLFFVNLAGGHWGYLGITIVQFVIEVRTDFILIKRHSDGFLLRIEPFWLTNVSFFQVVIVVLCWLLRDRSFRPSSSSSSHPPS
jgi:hypothetical protein